MKKRLHKVLGIRPLTDSAFVLRLERQDLEFHPGQHLSIGPANSNERREYSVYSPCQSPFLEVLIKEIPEGYVSPRLKQLKEGDEVFVRGPRGRFTVDEEEVNEAPLYFIATGTGIAPFHCFVGSYPRLNYQLFHGIRYPEERYEYTTYGNRYIACVSKGQGGDFQGRVTDYLTDRPLDVNALFFLCGNANMIYDAFAILKKRGVNRERIFTEVYF